MFLTARLHVSGCMADKTKMQMQMSMDPGSTLVGNVSDVMSVLGVSCHWRNEKCQNTYQKQRPDICSHCTLGCSNGRSQQGPRRMTLILKYTLTTSTATLE